MSLPEASSSDSSNFRVKLQQLTEFNINIERSLKAAQEICEAIENSSNIEEYADVLQEIYGAIQLILNKTQPEYLQEKPAQQLRKCCLEILQKIPNGEHFKPHAKNLLNLLFKLVEYENEENVLICVKLIIELHKHHRPSFSADVNTFLKFVREVYRELRNQTSKIFEPKSMYHVANIDEFNVDTAGLDTFTVTVVKAQTESGQSTVYHILPKSCFSLKVMQDIPILVVLMYQLYKQHIHQEVADFIPLIMEFVNLQPSEEQKKSLLFNHDVYVDFLAAQVKTLSFLAYVVKIYQELVERHATDLVRGMMNLLNNCPSSVTNMRKEFFIAARHILGTPEIRPKFVDVVENLCDESVLIGDGFTVRDSLRPLAYSTLADLTHHIRSELCLRKMAQAVNLFGRNIHDDSLPVSIQTMSLKLVLNLVECISKRSEREASPQGRTLLMKILKICVLKCKVLVKYGLPALEAKCTKELEEPAKLDKSKSSTEASKEEKPPEEKPSISKLSKREDDKTRPMSTANHLENISLLDFRSFAKALVSGMKTVVLNLTACKVDAPDGHSKQLTSKDVRTFVKLFKYAFRMLDVYMITQKDGQLYMRSQAHPLMKASDEKQIMEHLASTFTLLSTISFREVFITVIDSFVEGAKGNVYHHSFAHNLMINQHTSPIFAHILLNYLVERMHKIGDGTEESALYMKLFKICFSSVSWSPKENENMMKVHLKRIVLSSMECCLTSKEPSHYMYLLRALFRSIGGGSHEQLYREFFPLLPRMLTILNNLLRSPHRSQVRDLLGELCVIVPVRLSTLLPYLGMLMEPLVHVLRCNTVSQGLRTMELCVDNMQPDFLYDQIYSVRGDMMLALYNSLRSPQDSVGQMAYKVLGKLGPHNRSNINESQRLQLDPCCGEVGPRVTLKFQENKSFSIEVPVRRLILLAVDVIQDTASSVDKYTRERAWGVLHGYLCSILSQSEEPRLADALFKHSAFRSQSNPFSGLAGTSFDEESTSSYRSTSESVGFPSASHTASKSPKVQVEQEVVVKALSGILIATSTDSQRSVYTAFLSFVVRHFTLVAIAQQAGPFFTSLSSQESRGNYNTSDYLDPNLIVDAIINVMGNENKDFIPICSVSLRLMHSTAMSVLDSGQKVAALPLFNHLATKICDLLYDHSWFGKAGGCAALECLIPVAHVSWLHEHSMSFIRGLFFVLHELTGQISQGTLKMGRDCLKNLFTTALSKPQGPEQMDTTNTNPDEKEKKSNSAVTDKDEMKETLQLSHQMCAYLVICLVSENNTIRSEAESSLRLIASLLSWSLTQVVEPHRHLLDHVTPPVDKRLLDFPLFMQVAILDANYFLSDHSNGASLLKYSLDNEKDSQFVSDLRFIMESTDETLLKMGCYVKQESLISLRVAVCNVLSTLWYIDADKDKTFTALFKGICSEDESLHKPAYLSLKEYVSHIHVDMEVRHTNVKPILAKMRTWEVLKTTTLIQISYCAQLFHTTFSARLCDSLQSHLVNLVDDLIKSFKETLNMDKVTIPIMPHSMTICEHVIGLFHLIPPANSSFIPQLCGQVLKVEREMYIEPSNPLRLPLLKFLLKHPKETFALFLSDAEWLVDKHAHRLLIYCVGHELATPLREYLKSQRSLLLDMLKKNSGVQPVISPQPGSNQGDVDIDNPSVYIVTPEDASIRYLAVKIIHILHRLDTDWFVSCVDLITGLLSYWLSPEFKRKHSNLDEIDYEQWNEPKLVIDCLMVYFQKNSDEFDLLFRLVPCLSMRNVSSLHEFSNFLFTIANSWSPQWKRRMFLRLVEFYKTNRQPEMHYQIFHLLIIPSFQMALEKGQHEIVLGGKPRPNVESDEDVVSVFINSLIGDPVTIPTPVKVMYYQFACLLIEHAPEYIHDINSKRQGHKIRCIHNFAWPSVTSNFAVVDLQEKYSGLQLLARLISKFNIAMKTTVQVFHCLAKGTHSETKKIVNPSLDILIPAWISRTEDPTLLVQGTKKIMNEDQGIQASLHVINIIIRHSEVYYPVRKQLIPMIIMTLKRLSNQSLPPDQRRMILDMVETLVRWDMLAKQNSTDVVKQEESVESVARVPEQSMEKTLREQLANLMVRFTCQAVETNQNGGVSSEASARRALYLLEATLQPDMWGDVELKLDFLERYLATENASNSPCVCMTLEIIKTLFNVVPKPVLLANVKYFSKSLCNCLRLKNVQNMQNLQNLRIIKFSCGVIKSILTRFPADLPNKQKITSIPELVEIYSTVVKVIGDAFKECESRSQSLADLISNLQPAFLLLVITQQAPQNSYAFVDRCISQLVTLVRKLKQDIIPSSTNPTHSGHSDNNVSLLTDMLINGLDIIKSRLNVITPDMRKSVMDDIYCIIEKATDPKLIKAIISILKEWVNVPKSGEHFAPSAPEKARLFTRLWQTVSHWADNPEVMKELLEAVYLLYTKDNSRNAFQYRKLDVAFCYGLRSAYPEIRQKYIDLYLEGSALKKNSSLLTRLLFLLCTNPWDEAHFKDAYWIPTFLEVLLCDIDPTAMVQLSPGCSPLPPAEQVVKLGDAYERQNLYQSAQTIKPISLQSEMKTKVQEKTETTETNEDNSKMGSESTTSATIVEKIDPLLEDSEMNSLMSKLLPNTDPKSSNHSKSTDYSVAESSVELSLDQMLIRQRRMMLHVKQTPCQEFLKGLLCLTYRSNDLSGSLFADVFPSLWRLLTHPEQQSFVIPFLRRFLASEVHCHTAEQQPSPLASVLEAVIRAGNIAPSIPDPVLTYLGITYNQWHRVALLLEDYSMAPPYRFESQLALPSTSITKLSSGPAPGSATGAPPALVTSSSSQPGASPSVPGVVACSSSVPTGSNPTSSSLPSGSGDAEADNFDNFSYDYNLSLIVLYEKMREEDYLSAVWQRRSPDCKEMLQAMSYAQQGMFQHAAQIAVEILDKPAPAISFDSKESRNRFKFMDYCIDYLKQLNQWETLAKYGQNPTVQNHRLVLDASWRNMEWRKVPSLLQTVPQEVRSEAWRYSLIRAYNQLMEINNGIQSGSLSNMAQELVDKTIGHITHDWRRLPRIISDQHVPVLQACHRCVELHESALLFSRVSNPQELKSTAKTWRNRLPLISDEISFWHDIIMWRKIIYNRLEMSSDTQHSHRVVVSLCQIEGLHLDLTFAKTCRKQHLSQVASQHLDNLVNRVANQPVLNSIGFERIKQEFKLKMIDQPKKEDLVEGLELMEKTNIRTFREAEKAKFFSYKGIFFSMLNKGDEATKNLGYAIQMDNDLHKAWSSYGDFLENVFSNQSPNKRQAAVSTTGLFAMQALMEAACIAKQPESKSRHHIAKCLWLLSLDDSANTLAKCLVERSHRLKSELLLAWLPNIACCLLRQEASIIEDLMNRLCREMPTSSYLTLRSLVNQLDVEQGGEATKSQAAATCHRLIQQLRDNQPSLLHVLDLFCSQLTSLPRHWSEEALYELTHLLQRSYQYLAELRSASPATTAGSAPTRDSAQLLPVPIIRDLVRLAQYLSISDTPTDSTTQPDLQAPGLRSQLASGIRAVLGHKCQVAVSKLAKRWVPLLTRRVQMLPSYFYLDERSQFLLEYNPKSAELDLPGDTSLLKPYQHYLKLNNIAPKVRRILRHGRPAFILTMRASNGRLFDYRVPCSTTALDDIQTSSTVNPYDQFRESRPLQLFRLINEILLKEREPSRRHLIISTPRLMELGSFRMVEETRAYGRSSPLPNNSSISLLEVFESGQTRDIYEPLHKYWEKLASCQTRGTQASQQVLRDIYKEVKLCVDSNLLRDLARQMMLDAEDYWLLRKNVTKHLAVLNLCEFVLHLSSVSPDQFFIDLTSGTCQVHFFKFDIGEVKHELDANRPVPFRLSPNLYEFITPLGERGPLTACMVAVARTMMRPKHQLAALLRSILRDDYTLWYRGRQLMTGYTDTSKDTLSSGEHEGPVAPLSNEKLLPLLTKAIEVINCRLKNMAAYENAEPKASQTITSALSLDNLCRMEPCWYPWL